MEFWFSYPDNKGAESKVEANEVVYFLEPGQSSDYWFSSSGERGILFIDYENRYFWSPLPDDVVPDITSNDLTPYKFVSVDDIDIEDDPKEDMEGPAEDAGEEPDDECMAGDSCQHCPGASSDRQGTLLPLAVALAACGLIIALGVVIYNVVGLF